MKKIITAFLLLLMCFSLTSCAIIDAFDAFKHSISGEIIDSVDGFSVGEENDVLVYKENKYFLVEEINGECEVDITDEDILLGQKSNFPFFENFSYYASSEESPIFIMGGPSQYRATFVFLKEDIYKNGPVYVLQNTNYEFKILSVFIKTDKVDYEHHIATDKFTKVVSVEFLMKDFPRIRAVKTIYLIDNIWYCVEQDISYELSVEFVRELMKSGVVTACGDNGRNSSDNTQFSEKTAVFNTRNIKNITFYAYYGSGKGSVVPVEHLDEIITWLDSFMIDKEVPELLPPGTNTINVEIEYFDGTIVKKGLDTTTVEGITYYIKGNTAPECYEEIISKTSLN